MASKVEEDTTAAAEDQECGDVLTGAVFDLDGTLLATEEPYLEAYTAAAERCGHLMFLHHRGGYTDVALRSFGKEYTWETVHYKIVGKAELEGAQVRRATLHRFASNCFVTRFGTCQIVVDSLGLSITPQAFLDVCWT